MPVPKVSGPKTLNDFRPVALTSILIKTLEKLVNSEILKKAEHAFDPMQCAYRANKGGEDATVTLLDSVFKHLLLFVSFSSLLIRSRPTFFN